MKSKHSTSTKPIFTVQVDGDDADDESYEEPRCLCGCMRITVALKLVALLRLILDLVALFAAWDTVFVYFLAFSSIGTFTVLCIVISGLQEEKYNKIRYTKIWVAFKLIVTLALIITVIIGIYEGDFDFLETMQFTPHAVVLIVAVLSLMTAGILQWYLTEQTIKYLTIRDDIYTIPPGKFKWRPEILRPQDVKHEKF